MSAIAKYGTDAERISGIAARLTRFIEIECGRRLLARGSTLHFRHVRVVFVCHFPPQFCEMQESETNVGSAVVKGTRVSLLDAPR